MTDQVAAVRAALCREAHRFEWWAMDRAWTALQSENFWRYVQGKPLWTEVQPHHYSFLEEKKPCP